MQCWREHRVLTASVNGRPWAVVHSVTLVFLGVWKPRVVRLTDRLGITDSGRRLRPWRTYLVWFVVMAVISGAFSVAGSGRFAFLIVLCGVLAVVMGVLGVVAYRREGRAGDAGGRRGR